MVKLNGIAHSYASVDKHPDVRPVVINSEFKIGFSFNGSDIKIRVGGLYISPTNRMSKTLMVNG